MLRLFWVFVLFLLSLPCTAQTNTPLHLSLHEAILLSVRENPNVQQSQLNLVLQKFSLEIAQWQFEPHYSFGANATLNRTSSNGEEQTTHSANIIPGMSLQSPIGTQTTLSFTNNISNHYNPGLSLQIVQPLMRGFGRPIVEAALYNAIDSEKISRLSVDNTLRTTVTNVINAYLDTVAAQSTLDIDKKALNRAQIAVEQTALFIKAGHKAGNEIVTVKADVASAQTHLENDKNNLLQTRYALLMAIGMNPNTVIDLQTIDIPDLIKKYHIPPLMESKKRMLENDIQYQVDQITLHGALQRSLAVAEDNTRWKLDFTFDGNVGHDSVGSNVAQGASLNLNIPIDDKTLKQAVASAKIAIKQAEISLNQEKWQKETQIINTWNSVKSAGEALHFAEDAENLQKKTYDISFQKYQYGLIDSLALQSAHQQLITSQQALVSARINYLKALVNLDLLLGHTLHTWHVEVKYA
jgi:outer membrane protein TolC